MRLRSSIAVDVAQAGSCTSDSAPCLGNSKCRRGSHKKKEGKKANIKKNLQIINTGEGVEKKEPSYTVGGSVN